MENAQKVAKKIWVLVDNRAGNSKQAIAAARIIGMPYEEVELKYNLMIKLPNFMRDGYAGLTNNVKKMLKDRIDANDLPDVVISAGRRGATVAKMIKSHKADCKFIQIMQPNIPLKYVDFLILPKHDFMKCKEHLQMYQNKLHYSYGALVYFDKKESEKKREFWKTFFPKEVFDKHPKSPIIGVVMGGSSQPWIIAPIYVKIFLKSLEKAAVMNSNASLLISSSRRTPKTLVKKVYWHLQQQKHRITYYIYDYYKKRSVTGTRKWRKEPVNPYDGIFEMSDYIVLTADSISMASEACATGKPVYLYIPEDTLREKHKIFVRSLYEHKMARPLVEHKFVPADTIVKSNNGELKKKLLDMIYEVY